VLQERWPIAPTDTAPMLKVQLAELGSKLLQETLKDLPHCLHKSVPQPDSGITYGMSYSFSWSVEHVTNNLCTSPLTYICNAVLHYSVFPDRLKYAVVKPCFKKGSRLEIANYRPISLLTTFSKIIEKLIYTRLISHIEDNNILVSEQYRFRAHSSSEKAAFTLIDKILTALNNKCTVGGIL
jgi:hypothetical protein